MLTELGDSRATAAAGEATVVGGRGGEGGEGEGRAALRDAEAVKRGEHQAARCPTRAAGRDAPPSMR